MDEYPDLRTRTRGKVNVQVLSTWIVIVSAFALVVAIGVLVWLVLKR